MYRSSRGSPVANVNPPHTQMQTPAELQSHHFENLLAMVLSHGTVVKNFCATIILLQHRAAKVSCNVAVVAMQ